MSIIFSEKFRTFSLHTNRSTYQMKISDMGYLLHVYYGERIKDEDLSYLITYYDRGFSPNPNQAGNDRTISLDVMPQEFSGTGAGDFRISSIEVENSDGSRVFEGKYAGHRIYKGKYKQHGLPGIRVNENDCVDKIREFTEKLQLSVTLEELGIKQEDIPWMAENCMKVSAAGISYHPVTFSKEEIEKLYHKAM